MPVTSYEGRGYKKPNIDPEEHAPIYSGKKTPKTDPAVMKTPLRVILSKGSEKLSNPSLVNDGCIYIVGTNVKVLDIGVLEPDSLELLQKYYRKVNFSSFEPRPVSQPREDQRLTGVGSSFERPSGDIKIEQSYSKV